MFLTPEKESYLPIRKSKVYSFSELKTDIGGSMIIQTFILSTFLLLSLQRPTLTIAQGMVESELNPKAVGKAKEKGAWQVQEKHWGKVSSCMLQQAKQHEQIMNYLIFENNGDVAKAIMRYNGSGEKTKKYLAKVTKKAFELELLGV